MLTDYPHLLFLASIAGLTMLLLRRIYSRRPPRDLKWKPADAARPQDPSLEPSRWMVELYEVGRDLKADMETKMSALQSLIQLAREETARLEATIARAESLGLSRFPPPLDAIDQLDESAAPSPQLREIPPRSRGEWPVDDERLRDILRLAAAGELPNRIADITGLPLGEIELLLSLRSDK